MEQLAWLAGSQWESQLSSAAPSLSFFCSPTRPGPPSVPAADISSQSIAALDLVTRDSGKNNISTSQLRWKTHKGSFVSEKILNIECFNLIGIAGRIGIGEESKLTHDVNSIDQTETLT